jgi:hypothetical protein
MNPQTSLIPPLQVSRWFNTTQAPVLDALRGSVVAIHAFQMLCPACVSHGLPQATRLHEVFGRDGLVVIGLHTVFEHHAVMGAEALEAFIHEYRLGFPIGIDAADPHGPLPLTMAAWGLEGTPSLVLLDRQGRPVLRHFGHIDDLVLGGLIGRLLAGSASDTDIVATAAASSTEPAAAGSADDCGADSCRLPPPRS